MSGTWKVAVNDLNELFSLTLTRYLRESCSVEMSINEKIWKSTGFTFISCTDHVSNELIKLNGIDLFYTSITVKETILTRKRVKQETGSSESRRRQEVVNKFLEN